MPSENANPLIDADDTQTTLSTVMSWIIEDDNITKTQPLKEGQTGTYHILIKGKILSITAAALMSGQGAFNTQFFDIFSIVLPKDKKWARFIEYIAQKAKDGGLEETNAGMAADSIFETVCNDFEITQDKQDLLDRDGCCKLVEHNPHGELFYVLPSGVITSLYKETQIPTTLADVSQAMTAKGYKFKKTYDVNVGGKFVRCWYFIASFVNKQKGGV